MGLFSKFRRRTKRHTAADRKSFLMAHGRITDGVIIDNETKANGDEIAFYVYSLNGVDFESSEILDDEQRREPLKYAPGAKVAVRYDPKNQGNSMLV